MIRSFKTNILFSFCLLLLNSLPFANPQTYQCDRTEKCLADPPEYACGYYTNNCPSDICGIDAPNPCLACSNPDVSSYDIGFCNPDVIIHTCSDGFCNPDADPQPFESFVPVCGKKKNEDGGVTEQTFETACQLCQESDFQYFTFGRCRGDRVFCIDSDTEDFIEVEGPTPIEDLVCASFRAEDNVIAYVNVSRGPKACLDKAVNFYTQGACGPLRDDAVYCLPNSRPELCPTSFSPVCGFFKDEDGIDFRVMTNECLACAAKDIIYHIPGPCTFACDPEIEDGDCEGRFEPSCGTYQQGGEQRKVNLVSSCMGCHPSGKPMLELASGFCPGDEKIRCEDDPGRLLKGYLNPACGYQTEDCDDESCRRTFAEPYDACRDFNSVWYSQGFCPGDEGVSCIFFRARPNDAENVYEEVCGYTANGCMDDSCRMDYRDQYYACGEIGVLYFTKGPCS